MRVIIVFFVSLCFLLLGSHHHAHAQIAHSKSNYSAARHPGGKLQISSEISNQNSPVVKSNSLAEKKEGFLSIEDEDEELSSGRKQVLLANYFITLACISVLIHFYNYFKNRLPFCKHLPHTSSCKYLLQRALRI